MGEVSMKKKIEWLKAFFGEDIDLKDTRIDSFEGESLQSYMDNCDENIKKNFISNSQKYGVNGKFAVHSIFLTIG